MIVRKKQRPASKEELLINGLAQIDALVKILIAKGVITPQEFLQKTSEGRSTYQILLDAIPEDARSQI